MAETLSTQAKDTMIGIKNNAMADDVLSQTATQEAIASQKLIDLEKEHNILLAEGKKINEDNTAALIMQTNEYEKLKNQHKELKDLADRMKEIQKETGKSFGDVLKAKKESLEIEKKQAGLSKEDFSLLEKKLKLVQQIIKEQITQVNMMKAAAGITAAAGVAGGVASGMMNGPEALAKGIGNALTTVLAKGASFIPVVGPVAGAIVSAAGPALEAMITIAFWNIEKGFESRQKGLFLSTAMGGRSAAGFSVLGSGRLTSGEYGAAAQNYATRGLQGEGLINRGVGGTTGLEKMAGLEKVTGDPATVQKLAEVMSAITKGDVNASVAKMGALWLDVEKSVDGTGIAAQKVFQWTAQLAEQAQYLNVDYRLVAYNLEEMVKHQKEYATVGINVGKEGGKLQEQITGLSKTMSIETIAGLGAMRNPKAGAMETIASRQYGKNYDKRIGFEGTGENFKMTGEEQGALGGEALMEQQKDIKNYFYEISKNMSKSEKLALIPKMAENIGIPPDVAKAILMSKNYDELSVEQQAEYNRKMQDPTTRMVNSLAAIEKGLSQGMSFDKIKEGMLSALANIGIVKSFTSLITSAMNKFLSRSQTDIGKEALQSGDLKGAFTALKSGDAFDRKNLIPLIRAAMKAKGKDTTNFEEWVKGNTPEGDLTDKVYKDLYHSGGIASQGIGQLGENFSPGEFKFSTKEPVRIMSVAQANNLAGGSSGSSNKNIIINFNGSGYGASQEFIALLKQTLTRENSIG